MHRVAVVLLFVLSLDSLLASAFAEEITLVRSDAKWSYFDGVEVDADWYAASYDDSSWSNGQAPMGYGEGDEQTVIEMHVEAEKPLSSAYFRRQFHYAADPGDDGLTLGLQCDDAARVYVNGTLVVAYNFPLGDVTEASMARKAISGSNEQRWEYFDLDTSILVDGANVIAIAVHSYGAADTDMSFNATLALHEDAALLRRGPYLQMVSSTAATIRWRTSIPTAGVLRWGIGDEQLGVMRDAGERRRDHELRLTDLQPSTTYWYAIDSDAERLVGARPWSFTTNPTPGEVVSGRFWFLGDSGTANDDARRVYDAYRERAADVPADLWFMLGDNAYTNGTAREYQHAVFEMYPAMLASTCVWPCMGNHDGRSAFLAPDRGPYFDMFTLPTEGECGGVPSASEVYYSLDYGQVHLVCLDSFHSDRSTDAAMANWLKADLAATDATWVIVYFHHPPYTKGTHDSDNYEDSGGRLFDMRERFLPILEGAGVDLVLSGHSHVYERSFLMHGHYGDSTTLEEHMFVDHGDGRPESDGAYHKHRKAGEPGSVYVVAGSSGKVGEAALDHPAMFIGMSELGSMIVDFDEHSLRAQFIDDKAQVRDWFVLVK